MRSFGSLVAAGLLSLAAANAGAVPIYLNNTNITVAVGAGTSPGTFNNTFDSGQTIEKVIDAPSATASEFHNQTTHLWFTADADGGGLELVFDFGQEYDLNTLHFWNYTSEDFDVDNVAFTFFNQASVGVGSLSLMPALGSSSGILAQDIVLAAPINVRYVTAFLTGSNREVDFQNIGFTAELSQPIDCDLNPDRPECNPVSVPEPGGLGLLFVGLIGLGYAIVRRRA
jgi:hypothetical protein